MMLNRLLKLSFATMFFVVASSAFAGSISVKPAFNANCADLTGTWRGFFIDPTQLFGKGGPWPMQVSLRFKDGLIRGTVDSSHAPSNVRDSAKGQLWGACKKGMITDVYLQGNQRCGHLAPPGVMLQKNVLLFSLPFENAMTGTDFTVVLTRVNKSPSDKAPKKWRLGKIQTCH
jgi:hypothetical protein